jgi:hypothetical protein
VEIDGQWTLEVPGAKGAFHGRVERAGQRVRLVLP